METPSSSSTIAFFHVRMLRFRVTSLKKDDEKTINIKNIYTVFSCFEPQSNKERLKIIGFVVENICIQAFDQELYSVVLIDTINL